MKLDGVVRRIELYGAFVDLGLERDGLIHISQLSDQRVDRVSDVVKEGDTVEVWVTQVDPKQGRIALTMVKPPDVDWRELNDSQSHVGQVVRIERYGVFVDIGAERPGLLHSREMGGRFFRHPSEIFSLGDEVAVRILSIDRRKKRIDLTMENFADTVIDEEEESLPSQFEVAYRRAQKSKPAREKKQRPSQHQPKRHRRTDQDEILDRTLQQHRG
ncbi:MAG: S1 RNA-binding domain-containing protein [Anaerolineae bacterium]|nr:S1 RNA-binding domain-containing protein [Anaerolineae bacterium]